MRTTAAAIVLLALATIAGAEEPAPAPKLEEVDALRLKVLVLEHRALTCETQARLTATLSDAAKRAGLNPEEYSPDLDAREWRKKP